MEQHAWSQAQSQSGQCVEREHYQARSLNLSPPPPRTHPEELRWGNSMPVSQVHTDRALSGLKIIIEKAGRVRYKRCPACICSSWQPARGVWSGPSAAQSHRWGVMLTRLHLGGPREKKGDLKPSRPPGITDVL